MCARFKYSTAEQLKEDDYWGRLAMYGGGGYVQLLPNSSDSLRQVITQLEKDEWIDPGTRAVFVDFTAYNANDNLFAVARCENIWTWLSMEPSGYKIKSNPVKSIFFRNGRLLSRNTG